MRRCPGLPLIGATLLLAAEPILAETRSSSTIAGVPWAATEIAGRALVAEDPPTIVFLEDGSFSMFGGCNRFRGRARLSPGRISFSTPIAGTRMACPPERTRLERDMLDALARTAGYQRNGALLSFTTAQGVATARFHERPD